MTERLSPFVYRHIGPSPSDQRKMLDRLAVTSIDALIEQTIPKAIRFTGEMNIEAGVGEEEALSELQEKLSRNRLTKSFYGQGYHGCHVPPVIQRNLFENPAWYTSYTPYQPEISQGRLELLFHYQTLVSELTGLPVSNASLLDEATAIAEAAGIAYRHHRQKRNRIVVANRLHPQSVDVLETRAEAAGWKVTSGEIDENTAAVIIQMPDTLGTIVDPEKTIATAREHGTLVVIAADPMALLTMETPANLGADICVGSMQRYGVPMGNGGPHAAYLAVSQPLTRLIPGRLVGESVDAKGRKAYRLALQTREQHIRREKATSNICTAQALLANMSAAYAIWHGPDGLVAIANRIQMFAARLKAALATAGYATENGEIFDTVTFDAGKAKDKLLTACKKHGFLVRILEDDRISIAFDETSSEEDLAVFANALDLEVPDGADIDLRKTRDTTRFLTQPVFHACRSETEMMRFLRQLADKDLALDRAMIPLGSCTMKLNASAEMMPVSWQTAAAMHPFAPHEHHAGYQAMIDDLDRWLCEITGFAKVTFQPNAGSQGEFAGLLAIRRYHEARGQGDRNICLIPSSAHGTNPASAQMNGYDVVVVACTENGDIDLADLKKKAEANHEQLAALMVTYPSTHGVFEEGIVEACRIVHDHGGQVYLDGANLNALVGLARPGDFGADVCHMNLHKTFCIPHGGGGPGVGPIGVAAHLVEHLPGHTIEGTSHAVSAAPEGSASILPISWMYIRMMGREGLTLASNIAILSANYLASRIEEKIPVLYHGRNGRVAHECILDTRVLNVEASVTVDDIAKRLIDYGFHAPTMSWPVIGTLMVEPTESEPLAELDRFADAMLAIHAEAMRVKSGEWSKEDNPLHNAPHTAADLAEADWPHPYSRQEACFPQGVDASAKYWAPVARVDNVHGDRNLVCTCPPVMDYAA